MADIFPIRAAILDLYNETPNQGMRCLRAFLAQANTWVPGLHVMVDEFDVRSKNEIPGLDHDIYISSGGPGSPFDGENHDWEKRYFEWANQIKEHNANESASSKHVLFICHSFQMMCRCFEIAEVTKRMSMSFGITPIHMTPEGASDPLYAGLRNPFFAADFRDWQVVQPDIEKLTVLGGSVLSIEKERPDVPLERATTGIRLSNEMVGVQFHPEADVDGMLLHFQEDHRKKHVIEHHGIEKYKETIKRMRHPDYLDSTHKTVLPNFLKHAIECLRPEFAH